LPATSGPKPLPKAFVQPADDGRVTVRTFPGYIASFWNHSPEGIRLAQSFGIHFPMVGEGYLLDEDILQKTADGKYFLLGDLIIGIEDAEHYAARLAAQEAANRAPLLRLLGTQGGGELMSPDGVSSRLTNYQEFDVELPADDGLPE
jgi:hypothetical protein